MAIKTPETYRSIDGRLFGTQADAERHERLIETKERYELARNMYARALWETQLTADGKNFEISGLKWYYYITPGYYSMPEIRTIDFYVWNMELDEDDHTVILYKRDNEKDWTRYKINDLYTSKRAAQIELMKRLEQWLADKAALIDEFRRDNFQQSQ